MKYILDTDVLIYFLKGHEEITQRIIELPLQKVGTTIMTHTELLYGAYNSSRKKKNLEEIEFFLANISIIPFGREASKIYAQLKSDLRKKGNLLADMDLMIASIVLQHKGILVTNNTRHFSRIKSLKIENWYD